MPANLKSWGDQFASKVKELNDSCKTSVTNMDDTIGTYRSEEKASHATACASAKSAISTKYDDVWTPDFEAKSKSYSDLKDQILGDAEGVAANFTATQAHLANEDAEFETQMNEAGEEVEKRCDEIIAGLGSASAAEDAFNGVFGGGDAA